MPDNNVFDILVIDDDNNELELLEKKLNATGINIRKIHFTNLLCQANTIISSKSLTIIFLSLSLPDSSGISTFINLHKKSEKIPVIILSSFAEKDTAIQAVARGAQDYIIKGDFDEKMLAKVIEYSFERKRSQQALQEKEWCKHLFENNPFPMWVYDKENGAFLEVNQAALSHYGYTQLEFLNMTIHYIQHIDDVDMLVKSIVERQITGQHSWSGTRRHIKKDGVFILVEISSCDIPYHNRRAILMVARDMSQRVIQQRECMAPEVLNNRHITEAIMQAKSMERHRIGNELQDNVNQILGAAKLFTHTAMSEKPESKAFLQRSSQLIDKAIQEIRKITNHLISDCSKNSRLAEETKDYQKDMILPHVLR